MYKGDQCILGAAMANDGFFSYWLWYKNVSAFKFNLTHFHIHTLMLSFTYSTYAVLFLVAIIFSTTNITVCIAHICALEVCCLSLTSGAPFCHVTLCAVCINDTSKHVTNWEEALLFFKATWLHLAGDKIDLKEGPKPYLETAVSDNWKWASKQPHCKSKTTQKP